MPSRNYVSSLSFHIGADITQFQSRMQKMTRSFQKVGRQMQNIGRNFSTFVTLPLVAGATASAFAFDKQAKAIAQVEQGLRSTGGAVGYTSQQLQDMASELQKNSLFGDEEILKNATAQLLTFTNIAGDQFARTQQAALDLSARLDGDLKAASIQLGKALNDPISNLSALSRSGIQFSKDQKEVIKSLADTGRLAEAQNVILAELEKQYGGSAKAASEAGLGGFQQLSNSIGDLSEKIGEIVVDFLNPFVKRLRNVVDNLQNVNPKILRLSVAIGGVVAVIGPLLLALGTLVTIAPAVGAAFTVMTGPVGVVIAAIGALSTVVLSLVDVVGLATAVMQGDFVKAFNIIGDAAKRFANFLIDTLSGVVQLIYQLGESVSSALGFDGLAGGFEVSRKAIADFSDSLKFTTTEGKSSLSQLKDLWSRVSNSIAEATKSVEDFAQTTTSGGGSSGSGTGIAGPSAPLDSISGQGAGFSGLSELTTGVPQGLSNLVQQVEPVKASFEELSAIVRNDFGDAINFVSSGASSIAGSFADLALSGKASIQDFGKVIINTLKRMVAQLIATAVAAFVVKTILGSLLPGLGGGQALGGFQKFLGGINNLLSIPSLDSGGILKKDSVINAHKGEIVAPLSRLPSMLNQQKMQVEVSGYISNDVIRISNQRGSERYNRDT